MSNFEENVEKLLTEHPDAKVIFGAIKGIEGGKGLVVVFSYEKKDNSKTEALAKARAVKAEKDKAEKEAKKAKLEAKHKAELEAIAAEE